MVRRMYKPVDEKFKETILFILSKCGKNKSFGKTVLYKLLYFTDFNFYQLNYKTITGQKYRKIDSGPAPFDFEVAIEELEKEGKLVIEKPKEEFDRYVFKLSREPEIRFLSKEEKDFIEKVCSKLGNLNAKQISAISHNDIPWEATKYNEKIDYDLVFYREEEINKIFA